MKRIGLTLAAVLMAAGTAAAQVAAPSLNPTPIVFGPPGNPASIVWASPSRVAANVGRTTVDAPNNVRVASGTGRSVLGGFVGEHVAFAAAEQRVRLDADPTVGTGSLELTGVNVLGAVQFKQFVSLGLDRERSSVLDSTPAGNSVVQEERLTAVGFTLRLANIFYIGGAGGTVDFTKEPNHFKRNLRREGVALYHLGKGGSVHLEVYHESKEAAGTIDDGTDTRGISAEAIWRSALVSYTARRVDSTDNSGVATKSQDIASLSLGWVPESGLAVTITAGGIVEHDPAGAETSHFRSREVGVAWMF